jgi:uncharacterized protein YbjT (DUF2867 family)
MTQTAIVFGATGLVGKELVYELLEDNRFLKVKTVARHPLPLSHAKLNQINICDFKDIGMYTDELAADAYFCCIGTTIKKAGTQEAFRRVDLDIPVKIASIAESLNVPNLVVISSIGANARSSNFYLQTKGLMEQQVQAVYKGNLKFIQPSLLLGYRSEFRLGERIAQILMRVIGVLMIGSLARYKAVHSWDVARGMIKAMELPRDILVIESHEIHRLIGQLKFKPVKDHQVIK